MLNESHAGHEESAQMLRMYGLIHRSRMPLSVPQEAIDTVRSMRCSVRIRPETLEQFSEQRPKW